MSDAIRASFRLDRGDFTLAVDLTLPGRGITALFGPSGCGKTTCLRLLAGLERATGSFAAVGEEIWQDDARGIFLPTHQRPLGYVFQEASLFPHLSVRANMEFGLKRIPAGSRRFDTGEIAELLGIGHLLERRPAGLSGGERQRVAIARALLAAPRLLLMDEPLAALDLKRKQEILPYLERLHDELAIPVIYVSHSPDEVVRLADHIVAMEAGTVIAAGPLGETLARLDLPIQLGEDAGVVLDATVGAVDAEWHLARVDFAGGSLWSRDRGLPVGKRVRVRVLARDVSLAVRDPVPSSILNVLHGSVESMGDDDHPGLLLVRIQVGANQLVARLTRRSAAQLGVAPGLPINVQIKSVALME